MIFGRHRQTVPVQPGTPDDRILRDAVLFPDPAPRPRGVSATDARVLASRCAVVVTCSASGEGLSVTVLHPALFPPDDMTDALFGIVRSASDEGLRICAALVPSPCPPHVRSGLPLPFSEHDACAAASPLLWPSLSASPFPRPPAEGGLTSGGAAVDWPRGLVLGGSLPGEPFSLPRGAFCWSPLGWSP